jgi:glyoxylate reductase
VAQKPLVAVTFKISDAGMRYLRDGYDVRLWEEEMPPTADELDTLLDGAVGALTVGSNPVGADLMDRHPGLKVVSNYAVGYDNIDVPAATARGIAVCNTPDVLTQATAELAFSLLLATARRIPEGVDYVRAGKWKTWGPQLLLGQPLTGATLGIVGFGRIGKAVAQMSTGFGTRILAWDRSPETKQTDGLDVTFVDMDTLLAESDFVSIHVALSDTTRHLIGAEQLRKMKPTAILINSARGPVVDSDALVDALRSGQIFAAGLDVTDPEPIPADHPLVHMPNCVVIPHIGSATTQTRDAMAELAANNLVAVLEGRRPEAILNPEVLDAE